MIGAVAGPVTTGCAPPLTGLSVRGEWVKPGVDAQQLRRDLYECERHAVTTGDREAARALFERCMRARGYARRPPADQ
jgi:hypothetical protein